jgi:dipeptidyl-peptidase-4
MHQRQPVKRLGFRALSSILLVMALAAPALAQKKVLTLDDIFDPEKKVDFSGSPPSGLLWVSDTDYIWPKPTKIDAKTQGIDWLRVEAATGKAEPFFNAAKMESAFAKIEGVDADEARRLAHQQSSIMNPKRTAVVLTIAGDLYLYPFGADVANRLTFAPGEEHEVSFSPDGTMVGFVRNHNLYVVDVATARERALTTEGNAQLLNGELDWVYQ